VRFVPGAGKRGGDERLALRARRCRKQRSGAEYAKISGVRAPVLNRPEPTTWGKPEPLFDGKTLDGWKVYAGKETVWAAEDGLIVCKGGGGGWLGRTRDYDNFVNGTFTSSRGKDRIAAVNPSAVYGCNSSCWTT